MDRTRINQNHHQKLCQTGLEASTSHLFQESFKDKTTHRLGTMNDKKQIMAENGCISCTSVRAQSVIA